MVDELRKMREELYKSQAPFHQGQAIQQSMEEPMEDTQYMPAAQEQYLPPSQEQYQPPVPTEGQPQEVSNPFAGQQYAGVNIPDAPLSYGGGIAEHLLNDNEVPEKLRKKHWYIFHKDNTLTFLDYNRKASKLLNFDILKIDMLNSMPYYDYTFDMELELSILRNTYETKLDRALGFSNSNFRNERTVLQSQFQEQRMISEQTSGSAVRESFFKKLMGRR